jgi:predicted HD phosphohydrolase
MFTDGGYRRSMRVFQHRVFQHVGELIEHLDVLGRTPSTENAAFTELDHGLQCAELLRRADPDDMELQIAGLVHDVAHVWDAPGQPRHGTMGADAVRGVLGARVANLVEGHVPAKRYLVATMPEYFALLSPDSVMTLESQGGPMDDVEVDEFEQDPDHLGMVALRAADDGAKVPGAAVPSLDFWLPTLRMVAGAPR